MNAKLLVISGPNRGATYFLDDGETTLGRGADATVVLASTQVSKKHFSLACANGKAEIKDLGSSNGTFVNGVLTKRKYLANHDRISAGPYVLEIILPEAARSNVFIAPPSDHGSGALPGIEASGGQFKLEEDQPKSLVGKYWKKFDDIFLPVMYDFYEKLDYPTLMAAMFSVYVILSLGFAVYPVLQHSREEVLREAEHQAMYISEQVGYLNRQNIIEGKEGALMTDFAEKEEHVKEVVVANMEGRIMAPGNRLNEAFNNPRFLKYRQQLEKNQNLWGKTRLIRVTDDDEIYAFTPVMMLSKTKGIQGSGGHRHGGLLHEPASARPGNRELGVPRGPLLERRGGGGVLVPALQGNAHAAREAHRRTWTKVLKGDAETVEKKYKNDVVDNLIDNVNAALSRIPKADGSKKEEEQASDTEGVIINNMMRSIEYLAMNAKHPMMMVDGDARVMQVSPSFEELTGIRGAAGEMLESVSRDESFPALVKEMIGKAADSGAEGVHEDYDFNAGTHKIHGYAVSGIPGKVESYLFLFEKLGD